MATKAAITSTKKSTVVKSETKSTSANGSMKAIYKSVNKTLKKWPLIGSLVAEFIGAFLLTAAFIEMQGNPLFVAFALVGIVFVVGGVSGAHLNPAVTIGAWVTRKMNWVHALGFIVAQLLGAAIAYLVLNTFLKGSEAATAQLASAAAPSLFHAAEVVSGKEWYLFFAELFGTGILALGVATAIRAKHNKTVAAFSAGFAILAALYISMSLTTVLLTASGVSLTFLNPAIAFASNGLSWNLWPLSIYILAPAIGGVIGFVLQDFLHSQHNDDCECENC